VAPKKGLGETKKKNRTKYYLGKERAIGVQTISPEVRDRKEIEPGRVEKAMKSIGEEKKGENVGESKPWEGEGKEIQCYSPKNLLYGKSKEKLKRCSTGDSEKQDQHNC